MQWLSFSFTRRRGRYTPQHGRYTFGYERVSCCFSHLRYSSLVSPLMTISFMPCRWLLASEPAPVSSLATWVACCCLVGTQVPPAAAAASFLRLLSITGSVRAWSCPSKAPWARALLLRAAHGSKFGGQCWRRNTPKIARAYLSLLTVSAAWLGGSTFALTAAAATRMDACRLKAAHSETWPAVRRLWCTSAAGHRILQICCIFLTGLVVARTCPPLSEQDASRKKSYLIKYTQRSQGIQST